MKKFMFPLALVVLMLTSVATWAIAGPPVRESLGNDGGRPPTHPLATISYEKPPNSWDSHSATDPLSPSPLNPSVSSEGDKDSCRSGAADRRPPLGSTCPRRIRLARFLNSVTPHRRTSLEPCPSRLG